MPREFDGPWKETLERYFEAFIAFFFPLIWAEIDWSEAPVHLDTELQKILRDAEIGPSRVDKLTRVKRKDGRYEWLYIHIEIQSQVDPELPERIFVYHSRIYNLHGQHPASLVILGDEDPAWRPTEYIADILNKQLHLPFWTAKLTDYLGRWEELELNPNPIGLIVSAHLRSLVTNHLPNERLQSKVHLLRRLFARGLDPENIREMYKVIDWLLELPEEQDTEFQSTLQQIEEENQMPYMTSTERAGYKRGMTEGKELGMAETLKQLLPMTLTIKFGEPGKLLGEQIAQSTDVALLNRIQESLLAANSIEELRQKVGLN